MIEKLETEDCFKDMNKFQNKELIKKITQKHEQFLKDYSSLASNVPKSNQMLFTQKIKDFQKILDGFLKNYEQFKLQLEEKTKLEEECLKHQTENEKTKKILEDMTKKKNEMNDLSQEQLQKNKEFKATYL